MPWTLKFLPTSWSCGYRTPLVCQIEGLACGICRLDRACRDMQGWSTAGQRLCPFPRGSAVGGCVLELQPVHLQEKQRRNAKSVSCFPLTTHSSVLKCVPQGAARSPRAALSSPIAAALFPLHQCQRAARREAPSCPSCPLQQSLTHSGSHLTVTGLNLPDFPAVCTLLTLPPLHAC